MYSLRKIPAPFNQTPHQTAPQAVPIRTAEGHPHPKTHSSLSPILALVCLQLFSDEKKG